MTNIPIGKLGRILAGEERGKYVKVLSDKESTGGFLILTGEGMELNHGFDNWVKDEVDLEGYFQDSGWLIEWVGD